MSIVQNMVIVGSGGETPYATLNVNLENGTAATTVTATDGTTTVQLQPTKGVLPEGYTQLEYIESTGTQYIDTGVVAANNNSFSGKFYATNISPLGNNSGAYLFGTYNYYDGNNNRQNFRYNLGTQSVAGWSNAYTRLSTAVVGLHTFTASSSAFTIDGETVYTPTETTFNAPKNISMFAVNGTNGVEGHTSFRYINLIIKTNGTEVRNFIPAKRNSDDAVGMYDSANGVFYANDGTGEFVPGAAATWTVNLPNAGMWTITATDGAHSKSQGVVVDYSDVYTADIRIPDVPDGYTQVEYIQGNSSDTGASQIDTGLKAVSNNRFTGTFSMVNATAATTTADIVGISSSSTYIRLRLGTATSSAFTYYSNTSISYYTSGFGAKDTNKHTYDARGNSITFDGTAYTISGGTRVTNNTSYNFLIILMPSTVSANNARRHYEFAMYDTTDSTLICRMYPAIRQSDSAIGMYDVVRNAFYAATGSPTAGPAL